MTRVVAINNKTDTLQFWIFHRSNHKRWDLTITR